MNRRSFFTKAAIGTAAGVVAPGVLLANIKKVRAEKVQPKMAIDFPTICHIKSGGKRLTAVEVLEIWRETGVLIYESQYGTPPIPLEGQLEMVDLSAL